ncbi:MAG TPA: PD-(D/E)XK nuclease family protein [Thermoplasmata archaeon]|nr:PD-(D/E)XK nuclease family protein [Thermoplasmata archaeon]
MISPVLLGVLAVALVALLLSIRALGRLRRDRRRGALVSVDVDRPRSPMRASSIGLVGRPDELRRLPDGRVVPVELKSRSSPRRGPPPSHRLQVEAYCFLVEESTGRSPPHGVLRYGDGIEWTVAWNPAARARVVSAVGAVRRRYGGEAAPAPAKCARCVWYPVCDARAGS